MIGWIHYTTLLFVSIVLIRRYAWQAELCICRILVDFGFAFVGKRQPWMVRVWVSFMALLRHIPLLHDESRYHRYHKLASFCKQKGTEVGEPRTGAAYIRASRRITPRNHVVDLYYVISTNNLPASQLTRQHLHHMGLRRMLKLSTSVLGLVDHDTLYCSIRWHE
jgi:hypothetical protein